MSRLDIFIGKKFTAMRLVFENERWQEPCKILGYCPYGYLVEQFPVADPEDACPVYGHVCPVYFVSEDLPEHKTREG